MDEVWKPIIGWEKYYSISNFGRVRREIGYRGIISGRILKPTKSPRYYRVSLSRPNFIKSFNVHVLLMLTFVGKRPRGFDINHKDSNRYNNHIENLEYVSHSENVRHAVLSGTHPQGKRHGNYKNGKYCGEGKYANKLHNAIYGLQEGE